MAVRDCTSHRQSISRNSWNYVPNGWSRSWPSCSGQMISADRCTQRPSVCRMGFKSTTFHKLAGELSTPATSLQKYEMHLKPLVMHRQAQVASGCFHELSYRRGESLTDWLRHYNAAHGLIVPTKVPYYILLVGPPTDIPFWFQCELDGQHAVGRLCFEHADQYRKYVDSIIEYDSCGKITNDRTVLFWGTKHEADKATELSSECLISPARGGDGI